jgi:hypothetical protein
MRGDGTGRIALPLPQRRQPTSEYEYWDPLPPGKVRFLLQRFGTDWPSWQTAKRTAC